jgi:hypothetical protein
MRCNANRLERHRRPRPQISLRFRNLNCPAYIPRFMSDLQNLISLFLDQFLDLGFIPLS